MPTGVVELQKDLAALGMHSIGHKAPAGDLAVVEETRRAKITVAVRSGDSGFADQQRAFGSTLCVVFGHQRAGFGAILGAHACERSEHHAVLEFICADANAGEEFGHDSLCLRSGLARWTFRLVLPEGVGSPLP